MKRRTKPRAASMACRLVQHEVAERARRERQDWPRLIPRRRHLACRYREAFALRRRQRQQCHHVVGNALIERRYPGGGGCGRHPSLRRQQLDARGPVAGFDAPQLHGRRTPSSLALIVVTDFRLSELRNTYDVLDSSAFFFEERKQHGNDKKIDDGYHRRSGARAWRGRRIGRPSLHRHVEGEGFGAARISRSSSPRTARPAPIAAAKA